MRNRIRPSLLAILAGGAIVAAGCGWGKTPEPEKPAATRPPKDEIPTENLAAYLQAHMEGVGYMERYDYPRATVAFRKAHELAPGFSPGAVNLAIAMLNDTGSQEEKKAKSNKGAAAEDEAKVDKFSAPLKLLDDVIARNPQNLHARFCRGIILEYSGEFARARPDFAIVTQLDPSDANGWLHMGITTLAPDGTAPRKPQAKELIGYYTKALERGPYNTNTLYRLQRSQILDGQKDAYDRTYRLWTKLDSDQLGNPAGPGDPGNLTYGEMGQYATIIDPFGKAPRMKPSPALAPKFDAPTPLTVALPEGDRWVKSGDFKDKLAVLSRARDRFGAAVATFDANGDGLQDLYLAAAVVGPKGVRDALLINKGEGKFEDASRAFGVPDDRASLAVAAGDFDADRFVDLFLAGVGDRRLYRNKGSKGFENVSASLPAMGPPAISPMARWMDLDQDGDLDLYIVNYAAADRAESAFATGDTAPPGLANSAFRNDGVPPPAEERKAPPTAGRSGQGGERPSDTLAPVAVSKAGSNVKAGLSLKFSPWSGDEAKALDGGTAPHTGIAVLDLDDDRDLDLVLTADGSAPIAVLNDRLGRFRRAEVAGLDGLEAASGLLTADVDKDGRPDLVITSATKSVAARRNLSARDKDGNVSLKFEPFPIDAKSWRSASLADVDLDGALDLLGLPAADAPPAPVFARSEGPRFAIAALPLAPGTVAPLQGFLYSDLIGDPLPDLLLAGDGEAPRLARNRGNGHHWLGLQLGGRWDVKPKHMRTNSEGLGVRVTIEGDGLFVPFEYTTPDTGPAQSVGPVVLGLGTHQKARLVRLKWPDGVLQCELDEDADKLLPLAENNRKEGSCPVLFTWNGERMVCLGDFLGGGGLGYLVAPGVYGEPDRDEAVPIAGDQLKVVGGAYRMSITEPMSELAYLDKITLDVVDRPPGVSATPDERFAPGGKRPTGELLAWKEPIEFVRATDLKGKDVSEALRRVDRDFADDFARLKGWIGYAEEHGIVLDFGDRLSKLGPKDRVALVLTGYTEYPYSQTNYAATTAGVPLRPPVLERLQTDGSWAMIEADPGYPAGMERATTLELTGKLTGPKCVIRLRTNMEIGWDQALLAPIATDAALRVTTLSVDKAALSHRGYTREVSPDGRVPLIYDYDYVDPAPLANLVGTLTRFGDVAPLLRGDDDRLCVIGPGDEVRLEFAAASVPPLPEGWSRAFVLRTIGYCKDADPFTAASDTVGPLPWRGMPAYPFGPEGERPGDAAYREYLEAYQTRAVGR